MIELENIKLEDDGFYWLESKVSKRVYLGQYDADWPDGGCFDFIGNEEIFHVNDFNILGKIEVPDFIKGRLG